MASPRPVILITTDRRAPSPAEGASSLDASTPGPAAAGGRVRPPRAEVVLKEAVVVAVRAAGGLPLLVPPGALSDEELGDLLDRCDGVVVTGGAFDIHPRHYGREVLARLDRVDEARTGLELPLCAACLAQSVPILGICGGLQALAVAAGGTLLQDIAAMVPGALEHEQPTDPVHGWHPVALEGALARALGAVLDVNSTHHQAVLDPGPLQIVGRAPDGVVEAVSMPGHPFAVGVQWHPELQDHGAVLAGLLVQAAQARRPPRP